jgi:glycosyltransferase involved in cell wall biosynthesis
MKIAIIGPNTPIPPKAWGAVETLIWDMKLSLEELGHDVLIINIGDPQEIIRRVNEYSPDFVHINYDDWVFLYPYIQYPCAVTTHFAYIERPDMMNGYSQIFNAFGAIKPNVFCLSQSIKQVYNIMSGIPSEKLYLNRNGVNTKAFEYTDSPAHPDASIYLAKIDYRKRQHLFQDIKSLYFAGNIADNRFDQTKNYLGEWTKEYLYANLTNYGNLVLLSDGEAHSLVIMEALAAGLGVVVSEFATANLCLAKEFITVIPEKRINDTAYIEEQIIKNREYSINHREEIREYAKQFDWTETVKNVFIPNVEKVIANGQK